MLLVSYWTWGLLILLASLPHQVYQDVPAVLLSRPTPCGIIPPHSTVHIPLTLETQVTGEYRSTVYISTFGSQDPPMVSACFQNCSSKCRASCGDILTFACKVLTIFAYPLVVGLLQFFHFLSAVVKYQGCYFGNLFCGHIWKWWFIAIDFSHTYRHTWPLSRPMKPESLRTEDEHTPSQ